MPLFKDKLLNDNIFIWFGTYDEDLINNALILAGGDVLILKGIQKIELFKPQIKEDLLNMSVNDFIDKYNLIDFESIEIEFQEREINKVKYKNKVFELIKELKEGVRSGNYPPIMANYNNQKKAFDYKIKKNLIKISNSSNSEEITSNLEEIKSICEDKIQLIKKNQKKSKEVMLEKLKKISQSPDFNHLLKIQKEIDENVRIVGKKISITIEMFEKFKKLLNE